MSQLDDYTFKVLVIGSVHTGKTSLIRRFTSGQFNEQHLTTTLPNASSKSLPKGTLTIWDTAGSENWTQMSTQYYHGAQIVIYVASFDEQQSIDDIRTRWHGILKDNIQDDYITLLAINKCDLPENQRTIAIDAITPLSQTLQAEKFEVSAKEGTNVNELFERAFDLAVEKFGPIIKNDNEDRGPCGC